MSAMRSAVCFLLLTAFGISLTAPAMWTGDAASNLRACCRRNGKHHCAMTASAAPSHSGPSLNAAPCASFPGLKAGPASRTVSTPAIVRKVFAAFASHAAARPRVEVFSRTSHCRDGLKRGPPTSLS